MKVVKVGGGVLSGAGPIQQLPDLLAAHIPPVVLVVSALGKTTNSLESIAKAALRGEREVALTELREMVQWHREIATELGIAALCETALAALEDYAADIIGRGARGWPDQRFLDSILCIGEQLSSAMIVAYLTVSGIQTRGVAASRVIITDERFGAARPVHHALKRSVLREIPPKIGHGLLPVVEGYVGATETGIPTTLGREGSDYTAALLAAVLDAEELILYKGVPGVLTSDPILVPNARVLPELSYSQAARLFKGGANVVHPRTVEPVARAGIPIRIMEYGSTEGGTWIGPELTWEPGKIHAVAVRRAQVGLQQGTALKPLSEGQYHLISIFGEPPVTAEESEEIEARLAVAGCKIRFSDGHCATWMGLVGAQEVSSAARIMHELVETS